MKHLRYLLSILMILSLVGLAACALTPASAEEGGSVTVRTKDELLGALAQGASHIAVEGKIDLEGAILSLNYDVTLEGGSEDAGLEGAQIKIVGPNAADRKIAVGIRNLVLDGKGDFGGIDTSSTLPYSDLYSTDLRCIDADWGYYDLILDGVTIKGYHADVGPALFVENTFREGDKYVELVGCKIEGNAAETDVMHLSNDKLSVKIVDCEYTSNRAYKGAGFNLANCSVDLDRTWVHDNIYCPYDVNTTNPQLSGGGVSLSGVTGTINHLKVERNRTNFGGGLSITSQMTGNGTLDILNLWVADNVATYGGALAVHSLSGQPVRIVNSEFYGNLAQEGSVLYAIVYANWRSVNNGGLVEFVFGTFAGNTAQDTGTFGFYQADKTRGQLGQVSLKGCFAVGADDYSGEFSDYNYVATVGKALADGVVDQTGLDNTHQNGIKPLKGSIADIAIPASVYSVWALSLAGATKPTGLGKQAEPQTPKSKAWVLPVVVSVVSVVAAGLAILVGALVLKRKKEEQVTEQTHDSPAEDPSAPLLARWETLSEREMRVAVLTIQLKRRPEIAQILQFSENTIKKDLTSIYSKLQVEGKAELIATYKEIAAKE